MAIDTEISEVAYTGNGSTVTPYYIPFPFLKDEDFIHVEISTDAGETWTELAPAGFTLYGETGNSPYVATTVAYPGTTQVRIYRELPLVQPIVVPTEGRLETTLLDLGYDRATMQIQQVDRRLRQHNHDGRYYTEAEIDGIVSNIFVPPGYTPRFSFSSTLILFSNV